MRKLLTLSVSKMMLLLTASGFIVTLTFAGPQIANMLQERQKLEVDSQLSSIALTIGKLTHELQKERGASAGFISSGGQSFVDALPEQRINSDAAISGFLESADLLENLLADDAPALSQITGVRERISDLAKLRQEVDALEIELLTAVGTITALNRAAISVLPELGKEIAYAKAARAVQRQAILMTIKDISGLERATGAAGFARAALGDGVFPKPILDRFNRLAHDQDVLFEIYREIASDLLVKTLNALDQATAAQMVLTLRDVANSADTAAILKVSPEKWFAAATGKIDLIKAMENQGVVEILGYTAEGLTSSNRLIVETIAHLAGLMFIVGLGAMFLARRVVRAITVTADRVTAMATGDIESDVPDVAPADLKRITDALKIFRDGELERLAIAEAQTQLELNAAAGIKRMTNEVSEGDFSTRLRLRDLNGASKTLGEGLNQIMTVVQEVSDQQIAHDRKAIEDQTAAAQAGEQAVQELNEVVSACVRGDFSQRLHTDNKNGVFADLCEGVNRIGEVTEGGLSDLAGVLDAIASGNLETKMPETYEGIFLEISKKINGTSLELSKIVTQITNGAQSVQMSSAELSEAADDLAHRTEKTAAVLEEASESVEQLTAAVKSTAESAKGVGVSVRATQDETNETMSAVGDMVGAIEGIASSSEEIAKITSVIEDIAFQTNLLALNAGVEAARAGDSGRGFSVVASEVRNLAQRAAEAAKDISELISKSQAQVSTGVEIVGRSRSALESIQTSISGMTKEVVQMVDAAAEQSAGISEINNTVTQMEQNTQKNAAMFEETNAVAQAMKQEASGLAVAVSHFSTSRGDDLTEPQASAEEPMTKIAS
ncbi:methyl-accepting chemotaxis protein [Roseobacter sp.]|uniref:methyl-accepting chemotaxis protein n=1 Tax=Roseobacter sp. TaxID=1907202 RepID=UPI003858B913